MIAPTVTGPRLQGVERVQPPLHHPATRPTGDIPRLSSRIAGTGRALPERVLTNMQIEQLVNTTDEWIKRRTGIRERRILEPEAATSDLATEAGVLACAAAEISPATLDAIIVATVTADHPVPSCAVYVQRKLGAGQCAAFDVSAACAGFLHALAIGDSLIRTGQYQRVLVVGVDVLSRIVNWHDRDTCVLLGDGGGAVVLRAQGKGDGGLQRGLLSAHLRADGTGADCMVMPAGGSRLPASAETVRANLHTLQMDGKAIYTHAVRSMAASCQATLAANGIAPSEVGLVVAHQANLRILEAVAERTGMAMERFHLSIERYGNTSSASIPIGLDEAVRAGKLKPNMLLLLCAFGAGFTWGSILVRW